MATIATRGLRSLAVGALAHDHSSKRRRESICLLRSRLANNLALCEKGGGGEPMCVVRPPKTRMATVQMMNLWKKGGSRHLTRCIGSSLSLARCP